MVVYVEYVFLNNLIIDAMLISLSRKGLKLQTKKRGVLLSSAIGAISATVMPLLKLSAVLSFLLKLPIGLIIVALSGEFKGLRQYIKCFGLFIICTFAFGGGVTAVFWGLGLSFDPINYSHGGEIPIFAILGITFFIYKICIRAVKNFYKRKSVASFTVKCEFQIRGKVFSCTAFLDSGNCLTYIKTGSPIAVCSKALSLKLSREGALDLAFVDNLKINTVSGEAILPIFKLEKFLIYKSSVPNIINNVMLATATSGISIGEDFDLLIGPIIYEVE